MGKPSENVICHQGMIETQRRRIGLTKVSPLSVEGIKGPMGCGNSNVYVTASKHSSFCRCLWRTVRQLWKRNMRKLPIRKWLIQTKKAGAGELGRSSEGKATNPTYWKSAYWETQSDRVKRHLFWPARALHQPSSAQLLLFADTAAPLSSELLGKQGFPST